MPQVTDKFRELARHYAGAEVEHPQLKDVTLAQWLLESGRGASGLAAEHNNFGGLKWRSEMQGFATPVDYAAHDGPDKYCAFADVGAFVAGYWRFLGRAPYAGWEERANDDEEFIEFVGAIYCPGCVGYAEKVLNLRGEARTLLGGAAWDADEDGEDGEDGEGEDDGGHGSSEPHPKPPVKEFIQSPNRESRNGVPITRVILHYTAGPSARSAINTFLQQTGRRVSAHYVVDRNGDIYQMVSDAEKAWHCKGANADSIGIEHVAQGTQELTPAQEKASVALIKWLLGAYKLKPSAVTGHRFAQGYAGGVNGTDCPGALFGDKTLKAAKAREALDAWIAEHLG